MNSGNQLITPGSEGKELVSHRFIKASPDEASFVDGAITETFSPVRGVAVSVEILRLFFERKSDQGICGPVARQDAPDRTSIGIEVPLTRRTEGFPVNPQDPAIAKVLFTVPMALIALTETV